jgi:hypothetical protein
MIIPSYRLISLISFILLLSIILAFNYLVVQKAKELIFSHRFEFVLIFSFSIDENIASLILSK